MDRLTELGPRKLRDASGQRQDPASIFRQLRPTPGSGSRQRKRRADGRLRYPDRRLQGDRMAAAGVRRRPVQPRRAPDLDQVLPGARRFRRAAPGRRVRARRRLHAEHAPSLPVLLPRADVPQPADRTRLPRAGHGLPGQPRLRARLAHRDLPADGHTRARGPGRRRRTGWSKTTTPTRPGSASTAVPTADS